MKKYIVFALIALFAAVLFIACDNNVKVDNSVAFTQRIASEGAFVVNGKSYDSLQAAINAATGAKMSAPDPAKITLTKDYAGHAVSIPEDAQVAIDLNGHTLTFVDIKDTAALTVGEDAYFVMSNGTVTILDKTADLTLIDADDAHVFFSDVYADLSDDQNAVFITGSANGKAVFAASADSVVFGAVTAIGEHAAGDSIEYSDVALIVLNALSDVRMTNTYIDVSSTGHVTLNALAGENRFRATKGSSSITNNTDEPIVIFGGLYSITRGESSTSYYGSLQEALDSLDEDNLKIVLRDDDDSTNPVVASNGKSFTIVLSGNYYEPGYGIHATSITADADMEIENPGYSNSVIYSEIYGDIDVAGKFVVTGYYDRIHIDGTVTAGEVTASYAVFGDDINSSGAVEAEDCVFDNYPSITADSDVTITYSHLYVGDITSAGAVTIHYSDIHSTSPISANGYVKVTNVYGTIGNITASGVDDDGYAIKLVTSYYGMTVGNLNAGSYDIYIGTYDNEPVTVTGTVNAGKVVANYAEFGDDIFAITAVTLSNNSTVGENTDTGTINVYSPVIAISDSTLYVTDLKESSTTAAKSVRVTGSTGTIGTIVASDSTATTPVITLSTPEMTSSTDTNTLEVGSLNADTGDIAINYVNTGFYDGNYVYVSDNVSCATLYANNARFYDSSRVEASELTGGHYYGTVTLSGSGKINITSGVYEIVKYNGTGTLNTTLNEIVIDRLCNCDGAGTINVNGGTIKDIDNIKANVNIKDGIIYEPEIEDLAKVVNRINQDSSNQNVTIHFAPSGKEFLTSLEEFDMTSEKIEGNAELKFDMEFETTSTSNITSGLIVGSANTTSLGSVFFNYYNGSGERQLEVTGRIGLYGGSVIYSTQQNDVLVYTTTYESSEYKLSNPGDSIVGTASYPGYQYKNN